MEPADEHDEAMIALRCRLGETGHHVAVAPKSRRELDREAGEAAAVAGDRHGGDDAAVG